MTSSFTNCPLTDFTDHDSRSAMVKALDHVEANFGRHYPLIIGGERVETDDSITSVDPCDPEVVIGTSGKAGEAEAEKALQAALVSLGRGRDRTRKG